MTEKKNRMAGRTTTEVLFVFLLLILLGITVFTLAVAGGETHANLDSAREAMNETRTAMSFVQMKIRQNDIMDGVRLETNPIFQETSLVIREVIQDGIYETWIWFDGAYLCEALIEEGETVSRDVSLEIAALDGFELTSFSNTGDIGISVWKTDRKGQKHQLSSRIGLRSGEVRK